MQKINFTLKKSKGKHLRISINRQGLVFLHVPRFVPKFVATKFLQTKSSWVQNTLDKIKNIPVADKRKSEKEKRKAYLLNKDLARKLVVEKLEFWKKYYKDYFMVDFDYKKVSIKNTKTRWGSCSSKKNLNFSYRIIELPEDLQDYLVVHELSHLVHMNHSKNFWSLVALGIKNYKSKRQELRQKTCA